MGECVVKKHKVPTELVAELVTALRFDVRWAIVRVSEAFDKFLMKKQSAWFNEKKIQQLNMAKSRLFKFTNGPFCDDNARQCHLKTVIKLFGDNVLVERTDGRPLNDPLPQHVFNDMIKKLLNKHCTSQPTTDWISLVLCHFVDSLESQTKLATSNALANLKAGMESQTKLATSNALANLKAGIFQVDVAGRQQQQGEPSGEAKGKFFKFSEEFCSDSARHYHMWTLVKLFGKSSIVERPDGRSLDEPLPHPIFMATVDHLISTKCASKETAKWFFQFLDHFVDSLLCISGAFGCLSVKSPDAVSVSGEVPDRQPSTSASVAVLEQPSRSEQPGRKRGLDSDQSQDVGEKKHKEGSTTK